MKPTKQLDPVLVAEREWKEYSAQLRRALKPFVMRTIERDDTPRPDDHEPPAHLRHLWKRERRGKSHVPTPEQVEELPAADKVALRKQLAVLQMLVVDATTPPMDPALTPKEAATVIGYSVDWLQGDGGWKAHEALVKEFGVGFIMQPVENGKCHYSQAGLELLKRYWRGERAKKT